MQTPLPKLAKDQEQYDIKQNQQNKNKN